MKSSNTVLIALFAALIVVLSLIPPIPLPAIPVPVTLQTLGAMLAGAMLGPVRGALACLLYLALAAVGLPVLPAGAQPGRPRRGRLGEVRRLFGGMRGGRHRGGLRLRRALAGRRDENGFGQGCDGGRGVPARRPGQGRGCRLGGVAGGARVADVGALRGAPQSKGIPQLTAAKLF